ncbi:DUF2948 family protein [Pseudoxanthobacter sp.]|uniref:DUF2948 family protein n=1 Tax=Pseudoxanthobacter sp. TaxID=1925742 RepID=UPI002FDF0C58
MDLLRLAALDAEDLAVLSAHVQDAVTRPGLGRWLKGDGRFVLPLNRFAWEGAVTGDAATDERHSAVLQFDRVTGVAAQGVHPGDTGPVSVLLAVTFAETGAPGGIVTLHFAGGGRIRLTVECIEARLTDLGGAWTARRRPDHRSAG